MITRNSVRAPPGKGGVVVITWCCVLKGGFECGSYEGRGEEPAEVRDGFLRGEAVEGVRKIVRVDEGWDAGVGGGELDAAA